MNQLFQNTQRVITRRHVRALSLVMSVGGFTAVGMLGGPKNPSFAAAGIVGALAVAKALRPFYDAFANVRAYVRDAKAAGFDKQEINARLTDLGTGLWKLAKNRQMMDALRHSKNIIAYVHPLNKLENFDEVLQISGGVTKDFSDAVKKSWLEIPVEYRSFLRDKKYRAFATQVATQAFPQYADKPLWVPRDCDPRSYVNHSGGVHFYDHNASVVTEIFLDHNDRHEGVKGPTMQTILSGKWEASVDPGFVLKHEVGHAIDGLHKFPGFSHISDTPGFEEAYEVDIRAMGGEKIARERYPYYVRSDNMGRCETFAQLWAYSIDPAMPPKMASDFTNCYQLVNRFNHYFLNKARVDAALKSDATPELPQARTAPKQALVAPGA